MADGWQTYTDPVALARMERKECPECGQPGSAHNGAGGPGCSLTDYGVAGRIATYNAARDAADA